MVSWGRATVARGSSSFGSQGLPGRRGWVSQASGHCLEGCPAAHCWEAGWACWCNRAVELAKVVIDKRRVRMKECLRGWGTKTDVGGGGGGGGGKVGGESVNEEEARVVWRVGGAGGKVTDRKKGWDGRRGRREGNK